MEEQLREYLQSHQPSISNQSSSYETFQGQILNLQRQSQYPFNCIGCVSGGSHQGTGTLISERYVLTSAHNLLTTNEDGETELDEPDYFCLEIQKDFFTFKKQIRFVNYRYPKDFEEIYTEMRKYKVSSHQWYQLWEKSLIHDYAILKLENSVALPQYPFLSSNFRRENQLVTVYGYSPFQSEFKLQFQPVFHSGILQYRRTGGKYQIQTQEGQSGGPVFFMDETGPGGKSVCRVVGIHKGYDSHPQIQMSSCVLITQKVLGQLNQWHSQMEKGEATLLKGNKRQRGINYLQMEVEDQIEFEQGFTEKSQPVIKDGKFRIIPRNDTSKCIGDAQYHKWMVLSKMGSPGQVWQFKQIKKGEYCIFRHHQGKQEIAWGGIVCYINPYNEEQKLEEIAKYRWAIKKRGKDEKGQQLYTIMNICYKYKMNYDNHGYILLPNQNTKDEEWRQIFNEWSKEGRDLWYIMLA